jgi:LacI family transcriptional regulator
LGLDFPPSASKLPGVVAHDLLPQRRSLVAQTVVFLSDRIESGEWRGWLPSERALCELLQVSRNTLRAALAELKANARIEAKHGAGNKIIPPAHTPKPRSRSRDVALLMPEPIERLRPMQSLWIDDMRALLSERGRRLHVFHGRQYFGERPGPALQKLVTSSPHGCWILMLAGAAVQHWFRRSAVPCIVAGSTYPGLDLPFRDLDHRAMCRHAAGVLLGLGHRRLALLAPKSARAGDLESEAGFVEGVRQSRHRDATALVVRHDATGTGLTRAVSRCLKLEPSPTALLVLQPHYYLAAATRLAQRGVRIPQQISLISRDDDPFLSFVEPAPARYVVGPHVMAKHLLRPVLELTEGQAVTQRGGLIMPVFFQGESIGPAAAAP